MREGCVWVSEGLDGVVTNFFLVGGICGFFMMYVVCCEMMSHGQTKILLF